MQARGQGVGGADRPRFVHQPVPTVRSIVHGRGRAALGVLAHKRSLKVGGRQGGYPPCPWVASATRRLSTGKKNTVAQGWDTRCCEVSNAASASLSGCAVANRAIESSRRHTQRVGTAVHCCAAWALSLRRSNDRALPCGRTGQRVHAHQPCFHTPLARSLS